MWLGLLVDLGVDPNDLQASLTSLGLPSVRLSVSRVLRGPLTATRLQVELPSEPQAPRGLPEIQKLLGAGKLPEPVAQRALDVFTRLARVEGAIHGIPPEQVHFHEVGGPGQHRGRVRRAPGPGAAGCPTRLDLSRGSGGRDSAL